MKRIMERDLYPLLLAGAEADGWALYRLTDLSVGKKPFDIGGCDPDGYAVAVEVKVIDKLRWNAPLPWNIFEAHQLQWLKAYATRGGRALVVLTPRESPLAYACVIELLLNHEPQALIAELPSIYLSNMPGPGYRGWPRRRVK